ncbi:hypothetical protein [Rossellomorea sp. LjRoot5]|uniref:hypothetical protein n=1 Tax=Rossellomorea sp. LjRoot5 TaxID=3342331 RepID=UPI003ECE0882
MENKSRSITNHGNMAGVNVGDDAEVKAEDIKQQYNYSHGISEESLIKLREDIIHHTSGERETEETLGHYENLKQALKEHDKERAKKYWTWIRDTIGSIGSLITIGAALGI